jgi:CRISPR-associated protein Csb1
MGDAAERLLLLLALYKIRKLISGDLRLRTACDLELSDRGPCIATRPEGFALPALTELEGALPGAINACQGSMTHQTVTFEGKLEKAKEKRDDDGDADGNGDGDGQE